MVSATGRPLLLVRDREQRLGVFHNYCRHRGMRLVDESIRGRANIICPYHAWCYDLDGRLLRIPHRYGFGQHGQEPKDIPGLNPVRSALWNGIVFVDLSGQAPAFETYIAPLARRWAHYDFSHLVPGASMSFDVDGNWKLAIENFIDIYHVPYVHPSLNEYINITEHEFIWEGEVVVGQGGGIEPTDEGVGKLPVFPNLTLTQEATIEAISLFPNLLLTVFSDNLRAILVQPTGPGTCHERVEIFFVNEQALAPKLDKYRSIVAERFPAFNEEDVGVVGQLQTSFETSAFERAHFSGFFDVNVHRFQQLVARALI